MLDSEQERLEYQREHRPAGASCVRAPVRGSGTPMSRGWVPYGMHATLVCWDLDPGKDEVRVQQLPRRVGCLCL